jgi:alpha-1,3-rhamnosyl/mannosyltransferase
LIHDTIPIRHGGMSALRALKKMFLVRAARTSSRILTVSEYSRNCIQSDLGIPRELIDVIRYPVDDELVARVSEIRARTSREARILYVGRFAPHKNLPRLVRAFSRSRFAGDGGLLLCVGGTGREVSLLTSLAAELKPARIEIQGPCSPGRLLELYATSMALVLPSLEEGFGLPVWEAMTSGLPVCVSATDALLEITQGLVPSFDPYAEEEIALRLDETVGMVPPAAPKAPSVVGFAGDVLRSLNLTLEASS